MHRHSWLQFVLTRLLPGGVLVLSAAVALPAQPGPVVLDTRAVHASFRSTDAVLTELRTPNGQNLLGPGGMNVHSRGAVQVTAGAYRVRFAWAGACGTESLTASTVTGSPGLQMDLTAADGVDFDLRQWAAIAQFSQGTVQRVSEETSAFSSREALQRLYTVGRDGASVTILPASSTAPAGSMSMNGRGANLGFKVHLGADIVAFGCRPPQTLSFQIAPGDRGFPAPVPAPFRGSEEAALDSDAYRIAEYSSAAGVLGSYDEAGAAYPTLATPQRAYGDLFNFFDPDCWSVVATLAYSGDPLLQREARSILERSEAGMLPDGQVPHHFEHSKPVYLSIAQSRQTGPNLFWALAVIDYASATGDAAWLHGHYPSLKRAVNWILEQQDARIGLIHADGPLFIDVFRRSGYTLDTNTVALHLLANMADAADAEQDHAGAKRYRDTAETIRGALVRTLWDGQDHFVTEQHRDGTRRDFVDTDGNFAAIAFDVPLTRGQRDALLERLDQIPQLHPGGFGTWVSGKRYEKADCYGGNDGDSDVAEARIWWLDQLARIEMHDHASFDVTLRTLRGDLLRNTWLYERYDAEGKPTHNPYYHEYPEVLSMVLREQRYGIRLTPASVHVEPFGPTHFQADFGGVHVRYAPDAVRITVPGGGARTYTVAGLHAGRRYRIGTQTMQASTEGVVQFQAAAGVVVSVDLVGAAQ